MYVILLKVDYIIKQMWHTHTMHCQESQDYVFAGLKALYNVR